VPPRRVTVSARSQMRAMQSRLRLLSTPEVVDAAQVLRRTNSRYLELLDADLAMAKDQDEELRRSLWWLRQAFINRAKEALTLPRAWRRLPETKPLEAGGLDG
jgi:hypothetical protein